VRHALIAGVIVSILSWGTPAAAAPSSPSRGTPVASVVAPTRITLITGDTAVFARDKAGHVSVSVAFAPGRASMTFRGQQEDDGYHLVPGDAARYVQSGLVDRDLFNLDALAANGYTDTATSKLPVIVQYRGQPLHPLRGTASTRPLASINGAALTVDKTSAAAFWSSTTTNTQGLRKVWLDGRVRAADDESNAQIGAPVAWAAGFDGTGTQVGVIDTGVDTAHPDLAGRVAAARNFVPADQPGGGDPADVTDRHGHGTHVASTIAGSGAASGGRYRGVAPGARLTIAKALDDTGSGLNSTIIEAMQWQAATAHARIVSMSLGGGPSDGTDPLSQAVDGLTAQYGTLFVIAAGNSGPDRRTVAAPGAATSALTVGAVDKRDQLADFSSRGPRLGDDVAIKPEITGPGVHIVAARAAGTALGEGGSGDGPVDDNYTSASGTSMATPHVAGAAALLLARHPDWTPAQLKNGLVSTAADGGYAPYDQGSGRVDIGRAIGTEVFPDVSTVAGRFTYPYAGQTVRRRVTYRNEGAAPVTLSLSLTLTRGTPGTPAADGFGTFTPSSLVVPARGTAAADLTIEPTVGATGWYAGRLTATDGGGNRLGLPLAFYKQAPQSTLRVHLVNGPQWTSLTPTQGLGAVRVNDTDPALDGEPFLVFSGDWVPGARPNSYDLTLSLPRGGIYALDTQAMFWGASREIQNAFLNVPEVRLDHDLDVTLDVGRLVRVEVQTPRPSEPVTLNGLYARTTASGREVSGAALFGYSVVAAGDFWLLPSAAPTIGAFTITFDEVRVAPQVAVSLSGRSRLDLHPRYITEDDVSVPKFRADRRTGTATGADLRAGRDVHDTLVFLETDTLDNLLADLDRAIAGGASGVLTNNSLAWVLFDPAYAAHATIPVLWVSTVEAAQLRLALAGTARPRADIAARLVTPYEYKLAFYLDHGVPARVAFSPRERDLTAIETTYHARYAPQPGGYGDFDNFGEVNHTFSPHQHFSIKQLHNFAAPARRTEFYATTGPDVLWERDFRFGAPDGERLAGALRGFVTPTREREDWNEALLPRQVIPGPDVPGQLGVSYPCDACRQGDKVRLRSLSAFGLGLFTDAGDPTHNFQAEPGTEETHLFRGDTEIAPVPDAIGLPYYPLPAGAATYRFTSQFTDGFPAPHAGTSVATTWTFRSARPQRSDVGTGIHCLDRGLFGDQSPCAWLPLLNLTYAWGLAPDDTVPANRLHQFTISARQSGGTPATTRAMAVWTSVDGGRHWDRAAVLPTLTRGEFRVLVRHPAGSGAVWVRTQAWDFAGNAVEQVIADAYRVG